MTRKADPVPPAGTTWPSWEVEAARGANSVELSVRDTTRHPQALSVTVALDAAEARELAEEILHAVDEVESR